MAVPVQDASSRSCLEPATEGEPMANQRPRASELPVLLHRMDEARTRLRQEAGPLHVLHPDLGPARLALLVALETYAGALAATGWPLPYRLRDELFLYRRITGPVRPTSAG